jgi:hypothetical protein
VTVKLAEESTDDDDEEEEEAPAVTGGLSDELSSWPTRPSDISESEVKLLPEKSKY